MPKLHIGSPPRDNHEMTRKLNSLFHQIEQAQNTHTESIAAIQTQLAAIAAQLAKLQAAAGGGGS